MLLQSQQLSLCFLELLSTLYKTSNFSWQFNAVNGMLSADFVVEPIQTLVFFGKSHDIEPFISALPGTPKLVSTDAFTTLRFYDDGLDGTAGAGFNRNIVFIAVGRLNHKSMQNHLNNAFANIQGQIRGVFMVPSMATNAKRIATNLYDHFEWCWRNGFAYVLVLLESRRNDDDALDIYSYSRFPNLRVYKLYPTPGQLYFVDKFANMQGYKVRTPVQYDPPRVFKFHDRRTNRVRLKGYAAEIFQAFLKKHNAGLEIVQVHNSSQYDIPGIIQQLNNGDVDFTMNPYMPYVGVRTSYPIKMMQWCVLVPFSGEIEAYEYFLRPFRPLAWQACIGALIYLSLIKGLMDWLRGQERRKTQFGRAFLEIMRLMLFVSMPAVKLGRNFRLRYAFCFLLMAILGFMLSNLYLASLTSFLAKLIFERQIDTIADMVARNIQIQALDYEIPVILRNQGLTPGFARLLVPRKSPDLLRELLALKTGQAYAAREDTLTFVLFQQNHMLRPILHIANECFTTVPVAFLMPTHSQFELVLNSFTLRCAAAGLNDKWIRDSMTDGYRANILHVRRDYIETPGPLSLQHFQFAWIVLCFGLLLACFSFIAENSTRITRRIRIRFIYV